MYTHLSNLVDPANMTDSKAAFQRRGCCSHVTKATTGRRKYNKCSAQQGNANSSQCVEDEADGAPERCWQHVLLDIVARKKSTLMLPVQLGPRLQ